MDRIMIILPNDNLGGAEQYLKMVAEHFFKSGSCVDVFFLKQRITGAWDKLESKRFRLFFTERKTEKFGALAILTILFRNRKNIYDFVFTSHVHVNSFVGLLRRLKIVKSRFHVARESTSIFTRYKGRKLAIFKLHYRWNYHNIDLLICQTEFMRNQLDTGIPSLFEKIKVEVIPNPIDLENLPSQAHKEQLPYSNYIVSAGRLIPEKGFDVLIESFANVSKLFPDLKLVILGDGLLKPILQAKIAKLGLTKKVFLPGFVKNVYPYFANARLCVVSSRIEGFPNVLLQMMSQNTGVVSTLCAGGIEELKGLVTCPINDSVALSQCMRVALELESSSNRAIFDKELRERSIEVFVGKVKYLLNEEN